MLEAGNVALTMSPATVSFSDTPYCHNCGVEVDSMLTVPMLPIRGG